MTLDTECGICALIERIGAGGFADFIAELPTCHVILGDAQFYRGYCLMLAKRHATEIFLMPPAEARALFEELRLVAEAIAAVTKPWKMNYACLGNAEPHVHWHLFPRYESDELRRDAVWIRQEAERKIALPEADRIALIASLRREIAARIPDARLPAN
ncbi:MAG TPA: HIT family protein [Candidatus Binataceae bacterium]|nr:HIT family protein [Candidatus Binataceae bacterium]